MTHKPSPEAAAEPPILKLKLCPHCQAVCSEEQAQCWMCFRSLDGVASDSPSPYAVTATLQQSDFPGNYSHAGRPTENSKALDVLFIVLLIASLVAAVLIGIGLTVEDPGLLFPYLLFVGPAFLVTGVRAIWQVGSTGSVRPVQLFLSLALTFSITVLLVVVLCVAAIALLFFACLRELSH